MDSNSIIALIPEDIFTDIPAEKHNHVKAKIAKFFKEANPDLFEQLTAAESVAPELQESVVAKLREAAAAARKHHDEMVKLHGKK